MGAERHHDGALVEKGQHNLERMKAHARGDVHVQIGMMHPVQAP